MVVESGLWWDTDADSASGADARAHIGDRGANCDAGNQLRVRMLTTIEDSHAFVVTTASLPPGAQEGDAYLHDHGGPIVVKQIGKRYTCVTQTSKYRKGEELTDATCPDLANRVKRHWAPGLCEVID